jgi:hypothetical protein
MAEPGRRHVGPARLTGEEPPMPAGSDVMSDGFDGAEYDLETDRDIEV